MTIIKALALYCPADIRTAIAAPPEWFDADGYLVIWCQTDKFAPEDDIIGETKYLVTFRRLRSKPVRTIRGYRIVVGESRAEMYYLLQAIQQLCQTQSITVKDYIHPEWQDFAAAKAGTTEPCTIRTGKIMNLTPTGGLAGERQVGWFMGENTGDCSFSFQEAKVR